MIEEDHKCVEKDQRKVCELDGEIEEYDRMNKNL